MSETRAADIPVWVRAFVWASALGLAGLGVVLSVLSSSLWPLLAFAGLGLPMLPVGPPRTARPSS